MLCIVCGKPATPKFAFCDDCIHDVVDTVEQKRELIINGAIRHVKDEAEQVYAKDPTKGRGRGPKWMDG